MNNKKRIMFVLIIVILIAIAGLYVTYATDTTEEQSSEYDITLNFDLANNLKKEMTIEPGKSKIFDIDITNPHNDSIKYGISYMLVGGSEIPESDFTITQLSNSENPTVGTIEANKTISVSIMITNNSTSSQSIKLNIVNGYKNGGDLIVNAPNNDEDDYKLIEPPIFVETSSLQTLINLGLDDELQTNTPNFANTSCSSECNENTVGIYSMEDDLGTSYYFRGDVTNNYVYFGNVYWRIIRINGDGTVRMIYDGTTKHANGVSSTQRHIIEKEFYLPEIAFDNAYLGYMYGETGLSENDENVYNRRFTNTNDSTIKDYLENTWYPSFYNNLSQEHKNLIADAIYCNDRNSEIVTGSGDAMQKFYAAYQRLDEPTTPEPILTCTNVNDRFTLNNSTFSVSTNKKLDVPVGLITADEIVLAGASKNSANNSFYLYTGNYYWTITPYDFFGSGPARIFTLGDDGKLGSNYVPGAFWVRPVISLEADALKYSVTSNGSFEYPFTVTG